MKEIEPGYYIRKSVRKGKKYDILTKRGDGYWYLLSFGALGYPQYKDSTPLKLYKHLDHNNEERRKRYYQRHGRESSRLSSKYWSNKYLW
jgi:hypothetical protein